LNIPLFTAPPCGVRKTSNAILIFYGENVNTTSFAWKVGVCAKLWNKMQFVNEINVLQLFAVVRNMIMRTCLFVLQT